MKEEGNKKAVGGEKCKIRDWRPPGGGEQTELDKDRGEREQLNFPGTLLNFQPFSVEILISR